MTQNFQPRTLAYTGLGYWAGQFTGLLVGVVLCLGGASVLLLVPTEVAISRGIGVMLVLFALMFMVMFIVMFLGWRKSSPEQRAVYAWTIMQRHASRWQQHPQNPMGKMSSAMMWKLARAARRDELSAREIHNLWMLRPSVPYPGTIPLTRTSMSPAEMP